MNKVPPLCIPGLVAAEDILEGEDPPGCSLRYTQFHYAYIHLDLCVYIYTGFWVTYWWLKTANRDYRVVAFPCSLLSPSKVGCWRSMIVARYRRGLMT